MSKIKPTADYVLIDPMQKETTTPSGIVIPDTAKEKPQEGEVVAVGPGKNVDGDLVPVQVKAGDKVVFKKWGGTEISSNGKEYLLVKEEDILAIIE